jgi:hypothetical protein
MKQSDTSSKFTLMAPPSRFNTRTPEGPGHDALIAARSAVPSPGLIQVMAFALAAMPEITHGPGGAAPNAVDRKDKWTRTWSKRSTLGELFQWFSPHTLVGTIP